MIWMFLLLPPSGLALLRELEKAREERLYSERKREDLVKKARSMQTKTNNRRNQGKQEVELIDNKYENQQLNET